ncbi:DUF2924 domain-containing protein, partial [Candidatus Parcubacteria bacterium]
FFQPGTAIRAKYKGQEYIAKVTENGHFEFNGENFPSLYALSAKLQGKAGLLAAARNWKPVPAEGLAQVGSRPSGFSRSNFPTAIPSPKRKHLLFRYIRSIPVEPYQMIQSANYHDSYNHCWYNTI